MQTEIVLQEQLSNYDCSRTCLAMMLNLHVKTLEDVYEEFVHPATMLEVLKRRYDEAEACQSIEDIYSGYVYVVAVPAIYGTGESHLVIVDTRGDYKIYDPSNGSKYSLDSSEVDNRNVFIFKGFVPLIKVNKRNFEENF